MSPPSGAMAYPRRAGLLRRRHVAWRTSRQAGRGPVAGRRGGSAGCPQPASYRPLVRSRASAERLAGRTTRPASSRRRQQCRGIQDQPHANNPCEAGPGYPAVGRTSLRAREHPPEDLSCPCDLVRPPPARLRWVYYRGCRALESLQGHQHLGDNPTVRRVLSTGPLMSAEFPIETRTGRRRCPARRPFRSVGRSLAGGLLELD